MMVIQAIMMVEIAHELLSQAGLVTPAHLMFVQLHQLEEMVSMIQVRHVMMGTLVMEMDEPHHEPLSQAGRETPVHQISEQLQRLQSVEMAQLIQMRCAMMETQTIMMAVTPHAILSLDGHAQLTILVNDHQYDKME